MKKSSVRVLRAAVLSALCVGIAHADGSVVISQVYGGGGNNTATLRNDYVELFNRSSASVSLAGWCVQYASSAGTFTLGNNQTTTLAGAIPAGGYYLVQLSQGTGGTQDLPTPDASGLTLMSATSGKVALLSSCATALDASEPLTGGRVIDFVGFGTSASRFEGSGPTANLANATAAIRASGGCQDTDDNQADFSVGTPAPRNSLSPQQQCSSVNAPVVTSCPASVAIAVGEGGTQAISARDLDGMVTNATLTSAAIPGITLSAFVPAGSIGADANATLSFDSALPVGGYPVTVAFSNNDANVQTASCSITVSVVPAAADYRIHDIQGAGHLSPLNGQQVTAVPGIVTARASNGFYMQDWLPDANDATSEGIFVYTNSAPSVAVGDRVAVSGQVFEFRPGGSDGTNNLTTTEITSPTVVVQSSGNALPAPIVVGAGGRVPPTSVIDNDSTGSVETTGTFDAATDGIDFYESLEGMRVQINNPVASGPTNGFGEIPVLADNGAAATGRTARGGIIVQPSDFNPERIILDDVLAATPSVNVGATAPVVIGVMDYSFGNFKLLVTTPPTFTDGGLTREVTAAPTSLDRLTVASFNVENLSPRDPATKFDALAAQIVTNLRAPDIVAVMEIQDNNGSTNDSVVDASLTFQMLIAAIANAGGPTYEYRQIDPVDDQDGGEPGGNIRVGFLFNPARVVFPLWPAGMPTEAVGIMYGAQGTQLTRNPGRIQPTDPAFNASRKPLAGMFAFNGHKVFVIANHFNSKGGDQPLFGRFQPPQRSSELQRSEQAARVASFVQSLSATEPKNVIVLGDLNDFQFADTLAPLKSAGLVDLVETLPESERYTYVYDGNSQALDHIMASGALIQNALPEYDVVHVNSEFADQTSDHDPEVASFLLPPNDVTSQLSFQRTGLVLNRATQQFTGTLKITNPTDRQIPARLPGQLQVFFDGLPAGVTLANATGTKGGVPYIVVNTRGVASGATADCPVQFTNPSRVSIAYTPRVYAGQF